MTTSLQVTAALYFTQIDLMPPTRFALAQVPKAFFVSAPRPKISPPAPQFSRSTRVPGAALSAREGYRHVRNRRLLEDAHNQLSADAGLYWP